jgi:hypothetical protein
MAQKVTREKKKGTQYIGRQSSHNSDYNRGLVKTTASL